MPNRKRPSPATSLSFVASEEEWDLAEPAFVARVTEVHKRYAFVAPEPVPGEIDSRDVWLASMARRHLLEERRDRNFLAVGDRVLCRPDETSPGDEDLPRCLVEVRAPRAAEVTRLDPMNAERRHVLAANMSQLVVVASLLAPKVRWGLIDRYLVLAEHEGIKALLVLNKCDLLADARKESFRVECDEEAARYRALGYPVLVLSANSSADERKNKALLQEHLGAEISLLSGHSGVGKSSLVNLMAPEIVQDVEADVISKKGRHTTTYASLIALGGGGHVIDTPGIRSFALPAMTAGELAWGFVDLRPYLGHCRYRECAHDREDGCAIKDAAQAGKGKIAPRRYRSYLGLLRGDTGREGGRRDDEE